MPDDTQGKFPAQKANSEKVKGGLNRSPLKAVPRTTLSEHVAAQIAELISSGHWKPGHRLPPESELSRGFGVSRSTVREALKALAFVGAVVMKNGRGSYVSGTSAAFVDRALAYGLLRTEKDVRDLTDARMALESELVMLCAERATDQELASLEQIVTRMRETLREAGEQFLDLDLEFHLAIAAYSGSKILAQLLRTIRELLEESIRKTANFPRDRDVTYAQHTRILEALKERNARKARNAMRDHLRTFRQGYSLFLRSRSPEPVDSNSPATTSGTTEVK
ncbi:MAG TPA: FadR/GntR family transcriptional regulator [Terriglobales bacterium]|jgi:GntR family transcriptional repressor for pyruvate dehydrogenase complex|nr:FadR/GntR family transcriptional regulator [Terriglobia bacterium]HZU41438.1 FadR/GntR family transcriptional regulator [Terriglobales bacterium]